MSPRHFLTLHNLTADEFRQLIKRATELKSMQHEGVIFEPLKNRVLGMIFDKSSTRTRISFETGMTQFGGHSIFLSPRDTQLGRGEPIADSARVISRMVDCVMIRTHSHDNILQFAKYSKVPVINGLTDSFHPCQLLADMQTYLEHRGDIQGKTVAWIGDGNNMCHSYINAASLLDFELKISCPEGFEPDAEIVKAAGNRISIMRNPKLAVKEADLVATDVWASMGQEQEQNLRLKAFKNYQIDDALMSHAASNALFMHCLPAHRGEEVSAALIDRADSVVWDEAENRLHAQKALLEFLLT